MDFKSATDVLTATPAMTLARIAEAFGKDTHTIVRARMDGANARRPPRNWEPVVADLAREHAGALRDFAAELLKIANELEKHQAE